MVELGTTGRQPRAAELSSYSKKILALYPVRLCPFHYGYGWPVEMHPEYPESL